MNRQVLSVLLVVLAWTSPAHAQSFHWESTGGPTITGSFVSTVSPSGVIYASVLGPMRAIYSTTDEGVTWTSTSFPGELLNNAVNLRIAPYNIRMTPRGTLMISGSNGAGIFRSTNSGITWDSVAERDFSKPSFPGYSWFSNGDILRASRSFGELSISHDEGTNWQKISIPTVGSVLMSAIVNNRDEIYVITKGGDGNVGYRDTIFRSTDRGNTWKVVDYRISTITALFELHAFHDGSVVKIGPAGLLAFSDTSGLTWGTGRRLPSHFGFSTSGAISPFIAIDRNDNLLLLGNNKIYRTGNRGITWDSTLEIPEPTDNWSSIVVDSLNSILVGGESGVFISKDGRQWISRPIPNSHVDHLAISKRGTLLAVCGWDHNDQYTDTKSVTLRSNDKGTTWTRFLSGPPDALFPYPSDTGWVTSAGLDRNGNFIIGATLSQGLYRAPFRSTDDGMTWSELPVATSGLGFLTLDLNGTLWSNYPAVEFSSDDGTSWNEQSLGINNREIYSFAVAQNGNRFAGSDGVVFKNALQPAWVKHYTGQTGRVISIAIDSNSFIYAGSDTQGITRSTDDGASWSFINTGLPMGGSINELVVLPHNVVMAAVTGGLFILNSGDTTWKSASEGIFNNDVRCVAFRDSLCCVGTAYSGLFRANIQALLNVHSKMDASTIDLKQNFPNPFYASTEITYEIPQAGHVRLTIINMAGEPVATVRDELETSGRHSVSVSASGLPTGSYFYTLETSSGRLTKSFTVLR